MANNQTIFLKLESRKELSSAESEKQAFHLRFKILDGDCHYSPGDSVAIWSKNKESDVAIILGHFGYSASLKDTLRESLCITHLTPSFVNIFANSLNAEDRQKWKDWELRFPEFYKTASLVDLIELFPSARLEEKDFLQNLKKLKPRLYSIASAQRHVGQFIELAVVVVKYKNFQGCDRYGVASSFLGLRLKEGDTVTAMLVASKFKLPRDEFRDVIMVGPGTGIAPFRSFLQERSRLKQEGHQVGRNWLFFGGHRRSQNFYYQDELEDLIRSQDLTFLDVAFSRDQPEKIYVQHCMWDRRQELWNWIKEGACFYICGDATYMAKDVEKTLCEIISQEGLIDQPEVYLQQMKEEGRFQRDVY